MSGPIANAPPPGSEILKTVPAFGSLVTLTVPPWRSTMARDDREAESAAARVTRSRGVRLVEAIEDERHVFRRDARPVVGDRQHRATAVQLRAQFDASASWRMPDGVCGEILQRLLEPEPVAVRRFPRPARSTSRRSAPFAAACGACRRDLAAEQSFDGDVLQVERIAAALELAPDPAGPRRSARRAAFRRR